MACGTPVVSSRRGGPAETVDDGVTGILADSGDAEALAAHVIRLLGDAAARAQMGAAGRRHVEASFSQEAAGAAYQQIFEELLRVSS